MDKESQDKIKDELITELKIILQKKELDILNIQELSNEVNIHALTCLTKMNEISLDNYRLRLLCDNQKKIMKIKDLEYKYLDEENEMNKLQIKHLREINKKIVDRHRCDICYEEQKTIIFKPCYHFTCCAKCSEIMHSCPVCKLYIIEKLKVFIS